jgi:hypothetical protein
MKTIATIFLVFGLLTNSQDELGLGIIQIDIEQTKEIKIYKNKGDKDAEKIIRLVKEKGDIVIEEKDYIKWLHPETIWLDYSQFLFRYTQIQDNWIEVIINKETNDKRWILKSSTFTITSWDKFLIENTTAVESLNPTDIKVEPNFDSKTIRKTSDKDCFEAIEIKGDWIKIKTNETLECNQHPLPIKTGWIKWRENNRLTIKYFLTC